MRLLSALAATATITTTAATSAFNITSNNNPSDLLNTLLGTAAGLSNFSITVTGDPAALGVFRNDPFGLDSGIVLSTGRVENIPGENTVDANGGDLSTDFGERGVDDDFVTLDISFDADATAEKLFFEYVFGSEEFKEYGGDMFNDSFKLLLNGVNLAKLSDGQLVSINNLVPVPNDPNFFHPDYIDNPAGPGTTTKLDGFTTALTFEGLLNKNARNTLSFKIMDESDGIMDSAVFIKGQSLTTEPVQDVPEPGVVFGLVAMATLGVGSRLLRKQN